MQVGCENVSMSGDEEEDYSSLDASQFEIIDKSKFKDPVLSCDESLRYIMGPHES